MKQFKGAYIGPKPHRKGLTCTVLKQWKNGPTHMASVVFSNGEYDTVRLFEDIRPLQVDERPSYIEPPELAFLRVNDISTSRSAVIASRLAKIDTRPVVNELLAANAYFEDLPYKVCPSLLTEKGVKKWLEGEWKTFPPQPKENTMKEKMERKARNLAALIQNDYTTAAVVFDDGNNLKSYTYKVPLAWNVKAGDHLVVDSPSTGLTVVRVIGVDKLPMIDADASFTYKWAVQKVDRSEHDERLTREQAFADSIVEVERTRRAEEALSSARAALGKSTKATREFDKAVKALQGEKA